ATSGSAPSFTVSAQVVCRLQRKTTPSRTPLSRTRARTSAVMSTSSSRARVRIRIGSVMGPPRAAVRGSEVVDLVSEDRRLLELDRDVPDPESLVEAFVDLAQDALVLREVLDHGVAAHGEVAAGDGPDVEVVDVGDARDLVDRLADLVQIDVRRDGLQEDVHGLPDELPTAEEDQPADGDGDERVGQHPAGQEDHDRGGDGPDRAEQ